MKRFVVVAAVAAGLGLGLPGKADAQIVMPGVFNNTMSGGTMVMPGVFNNRMFAPTPGGVIIQPSFRSSGFNPSFRSSGFNQFNGMAFRNNFVTPNQLSQPMMFGNGFWGGGMNGGHMGHWHR